ncbi:hypothetical protein H012_gp195 [Acanthamoeba polyphaga moumouvirus]|uniref:Uncharacterized protein n=1 Tax=Acanthamoeba polyphaga moumouvirus TaxID=1269028 RepID=L7RD97_9VIRU|nr:hypothetical protein H012_gp195 [Acanthamoeba polyphaga moumouvirus]AGC02256.1 hypothetical protein Moumou_00737 [Acanthamoeba polyphaga moumouvirus]
MALLDTYVNISEELDFVKECFNYKIKYTYKKYADTKFNDGDKIIEPIFNIQCSHDQEFYIWSFTTDKSLENPCDKSNNIEITPDMLFEMFKDFKNGELSEPWFIEFPVMYKTHDVPLTIKIINKLKYSKNPDIKYIDLKPYEISEMERYNRKFKRTIQLLEEKYSMEAVKLNNKIETLETKLEKTKKKLSELKMHVDTECVTEADLEETNSEPEREKLFKESFEKYLSKRENVVFIDKKLDELMETSAETSTA